MIKQKNKQFLNMMKSILIFLFVSLFTFSCTTNTNSSKKINSSTTSKNKVTHQEVKNRLPKTLLGKWFTPHAAMLHIVFYENHTFVFANSDEKGNEKLETGTFTFLNNEIVLKKSDKTIEKFTFKKGENGDTNYYLQNEVHYMVKSED